MTHDVPLVPGFEYSVENGIAVLTISRVEKRNALSREMWKALPGIAKAIDTHPDVDVLIITGAGGHFSAGSDIKDLNVPLEEFWQTNSQAEEAIASMDIPTIAAIEGNCVGGGTEIAAACDVRIAKPGSIYGVTAARLGLVYPPGPTKRLAEIVGTSWARYILLSAEIVDFDQMNQLGFFHQVAEDPLAAARKRAEVVASRSALSQTGAKRILRGDTFEAQGWVRDAYAEEIVRGQEAFFERRSPEFAINRTDWPTD
ncbi:enoyl-CoA hydratase/isomerase family protein [Brevibacterium paucivorans]|uniref:Enoyl-CoA hydratase/isomerase family protein n=1 Tax=Brevibacterium paucivorans TaxID=170994 RepID=A0A2N6VMU8_9MICO|nr:enoyl-CoA hydratase/isomerase family protein [Brevibacterium paucivorans]PMD05444.1 enoyl-CoA hydratase/isomerase family protein [Brevibacterium paucivorans]